jgi:hypothetical protein
MAEMKGSQLHYKLINMHPVLVNNEFYELGAMNEARSSFSWLYRIPIKEFNILYRMRSAMMVGQFDHNKEILFPSFKNGMHGYDVITPFYYYLKNVPDAENTYLNEKGEAVGQTKVERAALAVNRGW